LASERCQVAAAVRVGGRGRLADLVREAVPGGAVAAGPLIEGGEPLDHRHARLAVPLLGGFGLGRRELCAGDGLRSGPEAAVGRAAVTPERLADAPGDAGVAFTPDERVDDVLADARLRSLARGGEARGGVAGGGLHRAEV